MGRKKKKLFSSILIPEREHEASFYLFFGTRFLSLFINIENDK